MLRNSYEIYLCLPHGMIFGTNIYVEDYIRCSCLQAKLKGYMKCGIEMYTVQAVKLFVPVFWPALAIHQGFHVCFLSAEFFC